MLMKIVRIRRKENCVSAREVLGELDKLYRRIRITAVRGHYFEVN
jgi:hypothetical protein